MESFAGPETERSTGRVARPFDRTLIDHQDLDTALRVLEECEGSATLPDLRDTVLDGQFPGYRHSTFILGPSLPQLFATRLRKRMDFQSACWCPMSSNTTMSTCSLNRGCSGCWR